jgi:hypothetical protein
LPDTWRDPFAPVATKNPESGEKSRVKEIQAQARQLKELVAELMIENRLLKKAYSAMGRYMRYTAAEKLEIIRLVEQSSLPVVRKNSTTVKQHGRGGCTRGEVRSRRGAPLRGWADRSDAAGVAPAPGNADPEREDRVLTKYVVGRDCNAAATTTEFVADGPRSTV